MELNEFKTRWNRNLDVDRQASLSGQEFNLLFEKVLSRLESLNKASKGRVSGMFRLPG